MEPALARFAAEVGLACVEVVLAPTDEGLRAITVESFPRIAHFGAVARTGIVDALVHVLTSPEPTPARPRHVPFDAAGGVA